MKKLNEKEIRYIKNRLPNLDKLNILITQRDKINKQIKNIRNELIAWDRVMIKDKQSWRKQ